MELLVFIVLILLLLKLFGLTSLSFIAILLYTPVVLIGGFFIIVFIIATLAAIKEKFDE